MDPTECTKMNIYDIYTSIYSNTHQICTYKRGMLLVVRLLCSDCKHSLTET